jgi:hypothetical protein
MPQAIRVLSAPVYAARVSIMGEKGHSTLARLGRAQMPAVLCVVFVIVTGLIGYLAGTSRERHSANAVVLTGIVTWSNEETRLIAFDADGVVREPNDGDAIFSVLADYWQDATGTFHDGGYPTCLASEADSPVSTDRHRVELAVIDWDTGGVEPVRIAVRVHCLD